MIWLVQRSIETIVSDGYPALSPSGYYWITAFTHDWRLETQETYNGSLNGDWDMDWGELYMHIA